MDAQRLIIMAVMGIVAGWLASIVVGGPGSLVGYLIAGSSALLSAAFCLMHSTSSLALAMPSSTELFSLRSVRLS